MRMTAIVASIVLTAVVPVVAYAAATPIETNNVRAAILQEPPIPLNLDVGLTVKDTPSGASLSWRPQHFAGGPIFYHVFRRPASAPFANCYGNPGAAFRCALLLTDLGPTRTTHFVDRSPGWKGAVYYVGVAANWLNDTTQGDVYTLSEAARPTPP